MGKVVKVERCRKDWTCSRCRVLIPKGSPLLRGELNFAPPIIRCCKCGLQPWEVTTSEYQLSVGEIVYRWSENYEPNEEGRDNIVGELEDIKSELEDRLYNMPEGLQEGDTGLLIQERIDYLESAISDLECIDFEELEEEDAQGEIENALSCIEI